MTDDATELKLFIDNDAQLYKAQRVPIFKNLATKKVRSTYKHDLAVKLFGYLVESGAKKYVKEYDAPGAVWYRVFDVPTRKAVAEALTRDFEGEFELGNYDNLLPKKYQAEMVTGTKKFPRVSHATKKKSMADYEAEGYKAHTWYVADAPYSQPKIRDAWQRGAWKWQQEQRALRPSKTGSSSHATRKKSSAQLDREITAALSKRRHS